MSAPSGELNDWTYREMIAYATWTVTKSIIKGELESGVESAIRLALSWQEGQSKGRKS